MSQGDLSESEWRVLKDLLLIEAINRGRRRRLEQNRAIINGMPMETSLRYAVAGFFTQIRQREYDLSAVSLPQRSQEPEGHSVTLAGIVADSGHYGIDSTTVRAHISAAGGKGDSPTRSWPLAGRVHQ
jgi:hypothetical protein